MTAMRAFAIVGWCVAMFGVIGAIVVRIVLPVPFLPVTFGFGPAAFIAFLAMSASWATVGAFLVIRRPQTQSDGSWSSRRGIRALDAVPRPDVRFRRRGDRGWSVVGAGRGLGHGPVHEHRGRRVRHRLRLSYWSCAVPALGTAHPLLVAVPLRVRGRAHLPAGALHLFPTLQNPFGIGPDFRAGQPVTPLLGVFATVLAPMLVVSLVGRVSVGRHDRAPAAQVVRVGARRGARRRRGLGLGSAVDRRSRPRSG